MSEIDYKAKCAEYERRMGLGEDDPAKDGYLVLVAILRQQNEYLSKFKISNKIASAEANDKIEYTNAKNLWEGLAKMIEGVNNLKIALKMEGENKKINIKPISATSIEEED